MIRTIYGSNGQKDEFLLTNADILEYVRDHPEMFTEEMKHHGFDKVFYEHVKNTKVEREFDPMDFLDNEEMINVWNLKESVKEHWIVYVEDHDIETNTHGGLFSNPFISEEKRKKCLEFISHMFE